MTYEQAKANQWNVAWHRMKVAEDNKKKGKNEGCDCENCIEHLEAIAKGK
jgi:hypothetical protein